MAAERIHICFFDESQNSVEFLKHAAKKGESHTWTINSQAEPGDWAMFYGIAPLSALVATGVVMEEPVRETSGPWAGFWMAEVGQIKMLKRQISRQELVDRFPSWGWIRQPRRSTVVPAEFASRLIKLSEVEWGKIPPGSVPVPDDRPPARVASTVLRVVRDTGKAKLLKRLYGGKCQVCGTRIPVPNDPLGYSEVHHIRPLGGKHRGKDNWDNMLVLCPNCHVQFDLRTLAVHPQTRRVVSSTGGRQRNLKLAKSHAISDQSIRYHWKLFMADRE